MAANRSQIRVILSKASQATEKPVPSLLVEATVSCDKPLPLKTSQKSCDLFFSGQAKALVSAMLRTLPGALFDQILIEMMQQRAVQLHVPLLQDRN